MKKIVDMFKESAMELKSVQTLSITAMLTALTAILGFFTIVIGNFVKIQFSFLTMGLAGMLFGPFVSGILGGISDIINFMIKPTGTIFPGFTLNAIISGIIYGIFLYKKPVSIKRVFCAKLLITLIVELCLSTTWLSILYGQGFLAILPMRIVKCAIMLPIDTVMLYIVTSRLSIIFKLDKKNVATEA